MSSKSLYVRSLKKPKFSSRLLMRCMVCGRSRAVHHDYVLCRIHMREYINSGLIPGFQKASW